MLVEHRGKQPSVDPSAYVAPNAVLCGDVHIGADTRVLFGAVVTAEDGRVEVGARCVITENSLVRARELHPVTIGDDVLVGPHVVRVNKRVEKQTAWFGAHRDDRVID